MESIFLLPKTKGVFDMELKAIQLTKQYGSKTAVNHLNLSLSNGVYGLLGANGAGKTTLMRLLCDIQPKSEMLRVIFFFRKIWIGCFA